MDFRADFLKRLPFLLLFLLAACSWNEPAVVELPSEIDKTSSAFVAALQNGDRTAAKSVVALTAVDEFDAKFAEQHRQLKGKPKLTPRFISYRPEPAFGADNNDVTVIYAAKSEGRWTTMEVSLFKLAQQPYTVGYWKISNETPIAKTYAPKLKPMLGVFAGLAGAIVVLGLLAIGIVLWIVRRKPHVVAPEPAVERRIAAVTTRENPEG